MGSDSYFRYTDLASTTSQMTVDNKHLAESNQKLREVVDNIQSTGVVLERSARENLNMIGPGEKLYKIHS